MSAEEKARNFAEKTVLLYYGDQVKEMGTEWVKQRSAYQSLFDDLVKVYLAGHAEGRRDALREILDFDGPIEHIKRHTEIALDQGCTIGTHSICELVDGVCRYGGPNCETD